MSDTSEKTLQYTQVRTDRPDREDLNKGQIDEDTQTEKSTSIQQSTEGQQTHESIDVGDSILPDIRRSQRTRSHLLKKERYCKMIDWMI